MKPTTIDFKGFQQFFNSKHLIIFSLILYQKNKINGLQLKYETIRCKPLKSMVTAYLYQIIYNLIIKIIFKTFFIKLFLSEFLYFIYIIKLYFTFII